MSNFIRNETKRFVPRDPPWVTKSLKTMLNRKNYKRHRYKEEDKVKLEVFRIECQKAVETAKSSYLTNMGNKVNAPGTSQKSYWKIINRVMNKCRAPKIPPILINNRIILDCREKAKLLCDDSVILPLKIIVRNILLTSIYPETWKLANVTPIFKKGDKQLIKNYRPISLLPICGKYFEKVIFNIFIVILMQTIM